MVVAALFCAARSDAAPILSLLPSTGTTGALPGQTVGWGYAVTNDDPTDWLVLTGVVATPFAFGTANDQIFDFPILAPQTTLTQNWTPGAAGLFELTWDLTAPAGFINAGVFTITAELWDADPFLGGSFVQSLPDFTAAYSASVTAVPEPATILLMTSGLGLAALARRRARRAPAIMRSESTDAVRCEQAPV
jgi:hypothetical protein